MNSTSFIFSEKKNKPPWADSFFMRLSKLKKYKKNHDAFIKFYVWNRYIF